MSERIQQSIARILSVGNEVEEIVYEEEWGNDEWSEEWSGDSDDIISNDELNQYDVEREDKEEDDEERTEGKKNAEIEENRGDSESDSEIVKTSPQLMMICFYTLMMMKINGSMNGICWKKQRKKFCYFMCILYSVSYLYR